MISDKDVDEEEFKVFKRDFKDFKRKNLIDMVE